MIKNAVLGAVYICAVSAACAQSVGVHVGSWHDKPGFNNANTGVYGVSESGVTVGVLRNSEASTSVYAGKTFRTDAPWGDAAVTVGGITGYRAAAVLPLVVPSVGVRVSERVMVRASYLAKVTRGGAQAVHLSIERSIR